MPYDCTDLIMHWGNWRWGTGLDANGDASFTIVKASVEYPAISTPMPITFPNGTNNGRTQVLYPGQDVLSEPVPVEIDAGSYLWLRVCTTGDPIPTNLAADAANSEGAQTDATGALVDSGTVNNLTYSVYGPHMITGRFANSDAPTVHWHGDSIAAGNGDVAGSSFVTRAMLGGGSTPIMPYMLNALANLNLYQELSLPNHRYRGRTYGVCKHWVCCLGENDKNTQTLAAMQANLQKEIRYAQMRGCLVHATTVTPNTTSTDAWATLGNQTINPNDAKRTGYNDWLRANWASLGLTSFIELADALESARNSGKFAVSGGTNALGTTMTGALTADGVHPTAYAHGLLGGQVGPAARFT
jgi:hypothetical protein